MEWFSIPSVLVNQGGDRLVFEMTRERVVVFVQEEHIGTDGAFFHTNVQNVLLHPFGNNHGPDKVVTNSFQKSFNCFGGDKAVVVLLE